MKLFVYQLGFEIKTKLKSTFKSISFLVMLKFCIMFMYAVMKKWS